MISLLAAAAVSIGYGISNQIPTEPVPDIDGGFEIRALFGGEHGDRWSAWYGWQPERETKEGVAFGMPVAVMDSYRYVAFNRRFALHNGERTWFAGTGIGYRDLSTCLTDGMVAKKSREHCVGGDAFVSSKVAFSQELGFKWKVVEVSLAHFSTGGISEWNKGVNYFRFTLFGTIGKEAQSGR